VWYDSDDDVGLQVAIDLANALAVEDSTDVFAVVRDALTIDPSSVRRLRRHHAEAFTALANRVRHVVVALHGGDIDAAAGAINVMLAEQSAHPYLAKEGGRWRLHHHPADAELGAMWSAIASDALARLIDAGRSDRAGVCAAPDCERVYVDQSKNASRRFCSVTCQNRVKAAAHRHRQTA
jgi:predicted RNA-binding Zn ribbon-like protein